MTRHLAITLTAAAVAFALIFGAKRLLSHPEPGPWLATEAAAFARARAEHKAVLIDFQAAWSTPSMELSGMLDGLSRMIDRDYVRLRVDVSVPTDITDDLQRRYRVTTSPMVLMVTAEGRELGRVTQFLDRPALRDAIAAAVR